MITRIFALGWMLAFACGDSSQRAPADPVQSRNPVVLPTDASPGATNAAQVTGVLEIVGPQPARDAADLQLRATVTNHAHQSWMPQVEVLGIGQLSLRVYNAAGQRMPTIPPPVPRPGDDRREPLHQQQSRTFMLSLDLFSPRLPPGQYTVRWGEGQGISGAVAMFEIH